MSEEFIKVTCITCGIEFGFAERIEKEWRRTGKNFHCPNGHSLTWPFAKETEDQKELKALHIEIKGLKSKLESALKDAEVQKKRADELVSELELWKPAETPIN